MTPGGPPGMTPGGPYGMTPGGPSGMTPGGPPGMTPGGPPGMTPGGPGDEIPGGPSNFPNPFAPMSDEMVGKHGQVYDVVESFENLDFDERLGSQESELCGSDGRMSDVRASNLKHNQQSAQYEKIKKKGFRA